MQSDVCNYIKAYPIARVVRVEKGIDPETGYPEFYAHFELESGEPFSLYGSRFRKGYLATSAFSRSLLPGCGLKEPFQNQKLAALAFLLQLYTKHRLKMSLGGLRAPGVFAEIPGAPSEERYASAERLISLFLIEKERN